MIHAPIGLWQGISESIHRKPWVQGHSTDGGSEHNETPERASPGNCRAIFSFLFKLYLFILSGRGQRERGRERIPSRLHTVSVELDAGLEPTNCEIMT